jgi:pyruvate/2-oxoglutarate dehydrogenase complex dihydrolipoamide acyltransferase (E2) component
MPKPNSPYEIRSVPLSRRVIIDSARAGKRKHTISALIEVDVTEARRIISAHKAKTGESISFTAFLLSCLGAAIDQDRIIHACHDLWGRLILFEEVDCTTIIEIDLEGHKFPLAHVIRAINKRSVHSIHDEIRSIQANPQTSRSLQFNNRMMGSFLLLPAFLRDIFYYFFTRSPQLLKQQAGTVMVSSVGMFGMGSGWGMGTGSIYTTDILVGGIAKKQVVVENKLEIGELLNLTINLDHDVIDGAPAARFVSSLKQRIESAYGLEEFR